MSYMYIFCLFAPPHYLLLFPLSSAGSTFPIRPLVNFISFSAGVRGWPSKETKFIEDKRNSSLKLGGDWEISQISYAFVYLFFALFCSYFLCSTKFN